MFYKDMDFKGKKVLITGASSGIGAALASEFARQGAELILLARNEERLAAVAKNCSPARTSVFTVDMASPESIDSFVQDFEKSGLDIDVMVLNAGISQRALTFETDIAVDRKLMEINYFGPVYLTKKLSKYILGKPQFNLAVTTSISGLFGFPLRSAYCASKHALFGFFETIDVENPGVKVTFLIPGRINTPISKSAVQGDGSTHASMDQGQANGMPADVCARIAVKAIARGRHRKLIGGKELLMVYIRKWLPFLFFRLAPKVSAT